MRLAAALASGFCVFVAAGFLVGSPPSFRRSRSRPGNAGRDTWLKQAGMDLSLRQFWAGSAFIGILVFGVAWALSGAWAVAAVPAIVVALAPRAYYSRRRAERLAQIVEAWPDGLRDVAASLQAGRSLPQAVESLAQNGPPALRRAFERFGLLNQVFGTRGALETIRDELADPTSDRVIEILGLAYERGGSSVVGILLDLAEAVTEDLRTLEEIRTAEVEQRINARAVFALPWFVLLVITIRGGPFREFYQSSGGVLTVITGAIVSLLGLLIVAHLSRVPLEPRVVGRRQQNGGAS